MTTKRCKMTYTRHKLIWEVGQSKHKNRQNNFKTSKRNKMITGITKRCNTKHKASGYREKTKRWMLWGKKAQFSEERRNRAQEERKSAVGQSYGMTKTVGGGGGKPWGVKANQMDGWRGVQWWNEERPQEGQDGWTIWGGQGTVVLNLSWDEEWLSESRGGEVAARNSNRYIQRATETRELWQNMWGGGRHWGRRFHSSQPLSVSQDFPQWMLPLPLPLPLYVPSLQSHTLPFLDLDLDKQWSGLDQGGQQHWAWTDLSVSQS